MLLSLYGVEVQGDLAILMRHRAVLFGLLGGLMILAAFRPHLKNLPAWQVYLALFFNADENWALSMVAQQKQTQARMQTSQTAQAESGFVEDDPSTWGNPGRNEACPCGSGKKFKHCHGQI